MKHFDNSGTVSDNLSRGWAERQKKALNQARDGADWRSVDAERQRGTTRNWLIKPSLSRPSGKRLKICVCVATVCDGNAVSIEVAERVIRLSRSCLPTRPLISSDRHPCRIATDIPHTEPLALHRRLASSSQEGRGYGHRSAAPAAPPCLPVVETDTDEEADAVAEIRAAEAKTRKR